MEPTYTIITFDEGKEVTDADFAAVFLETVVHTIRGGSIVRVNVDILGKANPKYGTLTAFGGGLKKGETAPQAALRELEEETCGTVRLTMEQLEEYCYRVVRKTNKRLGTSGILYFVRLPPNKKIGKDHVFDLRAKQAMMEKNLKTETRKDWRENVGLVAIPQGDLHFDINGERVNNIRPHVLETLNWRAKLFRPTSFC